MTMKILKFLETIFAVPLVFLVTYGVIYTFSWFLLLPSIVPFLLAPEYGFILPFLAINGVGVLGVGVMSLYADKPERIFAHALSQIAFIGLPAVGVYMYGW